MSIKQGILGILENLLRKFKTISHILLVLPLYFLASGVLGISLIPGILLVRWSFAWAKDLNIILNAFAIGTAIMASFFICGFAAMIVLPIFNKIFVGGLKEWKGPYYSLEAIKWYIHNGILYMLRYTFLEFVTPSPFSLWFYQAMGMKIGHGTVINSTHISDPSLIDIGNKVTIGGSATIVAHYGQSGYLVLAPVKIGNGVTVGLRSVIMGGVIIGDNAKILPNSVLLPKTVVPANEVWGGVPAQRYELRKLIS